MLTGGVWAGAMTGLVMLFVASAISGALAIVGCLLAVLRALRPALFSKLAPKSVTRTTVNSCYRRIGTAEYLPNPVLRQSMRMLGKSARESMIVVRHDSPLGYFADPSESVQGAGAAFLGQTSRLEV